MAKVLLKYKEAAVKEIMLDKELTTIGRKPDNDIVIDNQAVSGHHASIKMEEGDRLVLEDMNSLNGTYLNSQKISQTELFNGDVILIGVHTLNVFSDKNREADKKSFTVRGRSMDETMVIAPDDKKKILSAADKTIAEPLGGFLVVEGSTDRKEYELKERVSAIGKEDGSAIKLKGFFAPKLAALINRRKEGYFITPSGVKDLKVNGIAIARRFDLKDGDIVEIGNLKLQFYLKE